MNVVLRQNGGEFQVTGFAVVGERWFTMAVQKIRLERVGFSDSQQHGGKHHLTTKRDRLAAEFELLFVRGWLHGIQPVLRQRVTVGPFGVFVAIKDDKVFVRR